jgi:hypothetical protein
MKMFCTKISAMLLVVWYSLSIIGFDVHTCNTSGETFIATIASGFTCDDIHPEHDHHKGCHTGCGCHGKAKETDESEDALGMKSCCTGDFQVILLTGTRTDDNRISLDQADVQLCGLLVADNHSSEILSGQTFLYRPRAWINRSRSLHLTYNVWRI